MALDWVSVGDPGNAADDTGFGAVDHAYKVGKYEVTNAQYAGFLNAVAATDTLGLWDPEMVHPDFGGIERSGSSGSYSYAPRGGFAQKPVNFVSFCDALRFANWLQNGKPTAVGTRGPGRARSPVADLRRLQIPSTMRLKVALGRMARSALAASRR